MTSASAIATSGIVGAVKQGSLALSPLPFIGKAQSQGLGWSSGRYRSLLSPLQCLARSAATELLN